MAYVGVSQECFFSTVFIPPGRANYAWTLIERSRSTNGSALLWRMAVTVFLIDLVSEQITASTYRRDG